MEEKQGQKMDLKRFQQISRSSPRWADAPAECLQEDVSSHSVDDHVHPTTAQQLPHCLLQAALTIVHDGLCTLLHRQPALLVTSGCSYYLQKQYKVSDDPEYVSKGAHPTHPASTTENANHENQCHLATLPSASIPHMAPSHWPLHAPHTHWPWDPHFQESWNPSESD